jgi:hypothetical protein
MPPKKVTAIPTNSIANLFAAAGNKASSGTKQAVNVSKTESKQNTQLSSLDAQVQAFYNSLKPNERIAHEIAVEKLGTSYDVSRTHGFVKWRAANSKCK